MSIQLTEEQQLIGKSAREFAKQYLEPIAVELDQKGEFPEDVVKRWRSMTSWAFSSR